MMALHEERFAALTDSPPFSAEESGCELVSWFDAMEEARDSLIDGPNEVTVWFHGRPGEALEGWHPVVTMKALDALGSMS